MNRGSRSRLWQPGRGPWRFNEAPIHESGKWCAAAKIIPRCAGFNEAPIHESGK